MPAVKALAAKCIVAATVTVYCGPLKTSYRHLFFQKLKTVCKLQGFGISSEHALDLEEYPLFMLGKVSTLSLSCLCHTYAYMCGSLRYMDMYCVQSVAIGPTEERKNAQTEEEYNHRICPN